MGLCTKCMLSGILASALTAVFVNMFLSTDTELPKMEDGWWGSGKKVTKEDETIKKFTIRVEDKVLIDLKNRLKNTRYQTDLEGGSFYYGFQSEHMKKITKYWLEKYDWRKQEKILNSFDNFKTKIEGLDIHFIHAKPKTPSSAKVFPILIVHGWPGSIWEFNELIPLLTDHTKNIAFEVVCPSIPGYGYSDASRKPGFAQPDAARIFVKLMKRLGYDKFYVQGGDWGAIIVDIISIAYPQNVLGIHSNFFQGKAQQLSFVKFMLGAIWPSLVLDEGEKTNLYPLGQHFKTLIQEIGYFTFQATRPDTIAMALTDSPVGLASYILEKFCELWHKNTTEVHDCKLDEQFGFDEVLTNVMIYWTNQNMVSAMRFYKEFFSSSARKYVSIPNSVPAGLAQFPGEADSVPRSFADNAFKNIIQYTVMPKGGHFAAFEQPILMAQDIREFVRKVSEMNKQK